MDLAVHLHSNISSVHKGLSILDLEAKFSKLTKRQQTYKTCSMHFIPIKAIKELRQKV
jgi:hypothetical protein